jgi:hypothetical protein
MARNDPQVNLRIPAGLKERLDDASLKNGRSLTAEVVSRLHSTFVEHEHAAMIRALISFQEHLLGSGMELVLPPELWHQLEVEAEIRGMTAEQLVQALVSGALRHLDNKTETGKKLEASLFADLDIDLPVRRDK